MPDALRTRWRSRGAVLGVAALALGGVGEALLFHDRWRPVGALVLVAAALLAGLVWSDTREKPVTAANGARTRPSFLGVALVAVALLLWAGSLLAWWAQPEAIFGLQGALWLASMAALVVACRRWTVAAQAQRGDGLPWTRPEVALLASITAVSLLTHLLLLNEIPLRFHADEIVAYNEAMRYYRGPAISMFTTTWYGTSLPSLPFAFMGGLMRLVGSDLGGVRAGTALLGALTVLPVYGLGRLIGGRTVGAIAALAMATSAAAIHYSRVSVPNMMTPFFWAVCLYFLLKGLRSLKPLDFALAGLAGGLSMYTFFAARLLPYLLVAYVLYLALFHFRLLRQSLLHFALMAFAFLVGFGPLLAHFLSHPSEWAGRGLTEMSVPPVVPLSWDALAADWRTLAPLAWRDFLSMSVLPSNDHVYWAPLLLPAEGVLLMLGVGVLVWRWRQAGSFLLLLWGGSVLFVGGTLVTAGLVPALANWTPAFPVIYVTLALPPGLWLHSLRAASPRLQLAGRIFVWGGILTLGAANIFFYLALYPQTVPPAFESAQGRFLEPLTGRERVWFVGNSATPYSPSVEAMLAPQVEASELLNPGLELPLAPGDGRDWLFVFNEDEAVYLPLLRDFYPGGEQGRISTPGGSIGYTYRVPAALAERPANSAASPTGPSSGLKATVIGSGGEEAHRVDMAIGAGLLSREVPSAFEGLWPPPPERDPMFVPLSPFTATRAISWEGEVATDVGEYSMEVRTDGRVRLLIDGRAVLNLCQQPVRSETFFRGGYKAAATSVRLTGGWHSVHLDFEPTGNVNGLEWSWMRLGGTHEIVPPERLRHTSTNWPSVPAPIVCAP